ncbi:MAG: hypothetical protein ACRC62_03580 [Microcoleus sp.]
MKSSPDYYEAVDLPTGYKAKVGTRVHWPTAKGLIIKDEAGKEIFLEVADQTYKAASASTAPISHAAVAAVIDKANSDIASAIADWDKDRPYKPGNKVMRNDAWFKCVIENQGRDPLTDTTGAWGIFNPGAANDIFANRSPVASDVHPVGVKFWDTSFGASTPLGYVSLGNGAWQFLNQITLSRVRFDFYGVGSTYRSALSNIKFYKADGTEIPNGWWVFGGASGIGKPASGSNYTGQGMTAQYNSGGWCELEPSSVFDSSVSISRVTGSLAYATFRTLTFYYSNGGSKTFTPSDGNLATCSPAIVGRYGDNISSVLGETLTAAKLTNPASIDPGRLTGEAFMSAWNSLIAPLVERITALEARQEVRRSPDLPDFTLEWDIWERIAIDNVAWTITVTEYVRTSQTEAFPITMRPMQGEAPIAMPPPTHANARTNENGEFVTNLPGGGSFTYGTSRNGGNSYLTFPANVYKEESHYYVDANDAVIPMTTMAQTIAADSTALGVGAIAISTEAVAFVIDLYRLDNTKITYKIPLS